LRAGTVSICFGQAALGIESGAGESGGGIFGGDDCQAERNEEYLFKTIKPRLMRFAQFCMPEANAFINPADSEQIAELFCYLIEKGQSRMRRRVSIPGTALEIRLRYWHGIGCLLFRKNETWVYAHIFYYCQDQSELAVCLVRRLYIKFWRKLPAIPRNGRWVYTVPIREGNLSPDDLGMIHEIMRFIQWSIVQLMESAYVLEEGV